jgi:nucleotide-binding universal stress UspA family protein
MPRSILVPLDGSAFGEFALPLAASLARRDGASLHAVHVHQVVPPGSFAGLTLVDSLDAQVREDARKYLADVVRRLDEPAPVPTQTALIDGDVVTALRKYAAEKGIDLVVMSTHGRGALGRFWLGSVADELMRKMPVPVLVVRPGEGKPDLRRQPELKSILVPLDGTPLAEQVIGPAVALGGLFKSTFTLLRVDKPIMPPSYLPEGEGIMGLEDVMVQIEELQRQADRESRSYLDGIAKKLTVQGFQVNTRVVIDESPAFAILEEAQTCHADLIALETHGRHGLSRLLRGSVADKVVRGGTIPVLLSRKAE